VELLSNLFLPVCKGCDAITLMKQSGADFAIIGAGVFGVWTAYLLRQRGHNVTLIDAHGAGGPRSSSGDESRVIRMGYGGAKIYTSWAARSLQLWKEFFRATGHALFVNTGVLWLAPETDLYTHQVVDSLLSEHINHEKLSVQEIAARFPQIGLDRVSFGVFEPDSGVLLARKSVQAVLEEAIKAGVHYFIDPILPPFSRSPRLEHVQTRAGKAISADIFIFACGAWLPGIFPDILGSQIFPTRQEVFYFRTPAGTTQFEPPEMPVWLHHEDQMYGLPNIENRGVKIASDRHGERFDPESGDRTVGPLATEQMRAYVRCRLSGLQDAPLLDARVCQYENTSNGDFLIDRHPQFENGWLVGGGSGHGFKHGPAVGQHAVERILGLLEPEERFSLSTKLQVQLRTIY
jgi:sarcosine oxidase